VYMVVLIAGGQRMVAAEGNIRSVHSLDGVCSSSTPYDISRLLLLLEPAAHLSICDAAAH
jgi:hypothetical protein